MCQKAYNKSNRSEHVQQSFAPGLTGHAYFQVSIKGDEFLENASQILFNGSQDVDPLAMRTSWSPVITNKVGVDERELFEVSANRVEFRRTNRSFTFGLAFVFFGLINPIYLVFTKNSFSSGNELLTLALSFLFIIFGIAVLYMSNKLAVFDKAQGCFWKGRKTGKKTTVINSDHDFAPLEEIHAIQLLYWQYSGSSTSYWEGIVELNLVLCNGSRVNVSTCQYRRGILKGKNYKIEKKPRDQAISLGKFLGKPVWDAIDSTKNYWKKAPCWMDPDPVGNASANPTETT